MKSLIVCFLINYKRLGEYCCALMLCVAQAQAMVSRRKRQFQVSGRRAPFQVSGFRAQALVSGFKFDYAELKV